VRTRELAGDGRRGLERHPLAAATAKLLADGMTGDVVSAIARRARKDHGHARIMIDQTDGAAAQ